MFKIKKTPIDKFSEPGSYVGLMLYMGRGEDFIQWTILSYDTQTGKYTRSRASRDGSKLNQPYTINLHTHKEVRQFILQGTWKILNGFRNDIQDQEDE